MSDQECLMNSLKKELRSLLIATKDGLTPSNLEQEFKSMIGEQLPFRALGYSSVMELVQDMPDVVNICPQRNGIVILKAIADESTKEIASLVAKQKSRPKPQPPRHKLNFSLHCTSPSGLSRRSQISPRLPWRGRVPPTLPAAVRSELKDLLGHSPILLSDFDKAFVQRFGRTFDFMRYGFFSMYEVLNAASDIITIVQTRTGSMLTLKKSPPKKKPVKLPTCNVVVQPEKQKQTVHVTVPAPLVKTPSPISLPPMENQHVMAKQESDHSLVHLKMETPLARPVERIKQIEKELKMTLAQKGPGGIVSLELKEKIRTILAQHPEGLLASKLASEFEVHFKEPLPVKKLGFLNVMELVGALSDILHIECKEGEQDWRIFDIDSLPLTEGEQENHKVGQSGSLQHEETSDKQKLPYWDFPLEDSKNPATKFSIVTKMTLHLGMEELHIMKEITEKEIPPDAVQGGSLYGLPELGSSALVGLFVESIVSPSHFYVRIQSEETSDKLIDMMIEMRRCYSNKNVADRYVIPEDLIQPGHLCCIRSSEDAWWYRVIVHQVLSDQEVEVFYPDFGNMEKVQKSSLRFLKSSYAKLPAQAIPCSLAWVKPRKDDWTISALHEFQRLCGLKLLVGVVDEYRDGILYLFLCDTSSDEDIYLHNVLRLEGHAVVCKENIPSNGFSKLNPYALYIKPSPKQDPEADASVFQLKFLGGLPETTYSEPCKNEVVSQRFDKSDDLACLEPEQLSQGDNCFTDSSHHALDFQEKCLLKDCHENSSSGQNEQILEAKVQEADEASLCSDAEMPYLEPVDFCSDIWDEDWILSNYYKQKKNDETGDKLGLDIEVVHHQPPNGEGNKDEAKHSQEVVQKRNVDISSTIEKKKSPHPEPQGKIQNSFEGTERQDTLGAMSHSLSQAAEEFYVSIEHSEKSVELSKMDLDVNTDSSQFPQSASVLYGKVHSEKVDDASRTQAVALYNSSRDSAQRTVGPNALVFTAELQRSPAFCVPCNPTVALGASARLAGSGGCFPLSLRKMNI
ncbi:tudor domain-containing protein 5 isoform X4 [Pogona vitticeps]